MAVLAPTTVLVFQHYETLKKRFAAFPTKIEMLSRFRTAAEQKKILADLESGKVDVVIGTHRLLSKDIQFPDLGLLMMDEEQRFGVAHKERLKEMRKDVMRFRCRQRRFRGPCTCHWWDCGTCRLSKRRHATGWRFRRWSLRFRREWCGKRD